MRTALLLSACLLVTALAIVPAASAGPSPNCMPVYREYHLGPWTLVQRSSCNYTIRENGELTDPCSWEPNPC